MIQQKVTEAGTVSPHVFNNLINNIECESGECEGQVIFSGSYTVEQYLGSDTYFIDIYADAPDYIVKTDSNATYMLKQRLFGDADEKLDIIFSKRQLRRLQAVIDSKVADFDNSPVQWIGSKRWVNETAVNNIQFI
jgi:hypothetical protein